MRRRSFGCATSHQLWELVIQLLFFASPIIYPVGFLPPWAKPIAFISPVVQVMQDMRAIVIGGPQAITAADVYGTAWGYLVPRRLLPAHARVRALALPARVAVVRGAR